MRMARKVAVCGTTSGYTKHYLANEKPCEPCKTAKAVYRKSQYEAKFNLGKNWTLSRLYKISLNEYNELLEKQNGVCAICKKPESRIHPKGKVVSLSVDHDHACCPGKQSCGKCIRGLLCGSCNLILGKIEEFIELNGSMDNLINYLKGE